MGMWTAPSDYDYASEALLDLDEPPSDDYDEQDEADQRLDIEREECDE